MSIKLEDISKHYHGQPVVERVRLQIDDGELFVLLGPSGSGKSTILRMIAGLTRPDEGRIELFGRDVTWLPPQKRETGFVFQNYSVFRHMTVFENVEFGLRIRKVPRPIRRQKCVDLLELVGLTGFGKRYPTQLSGGQQQRVALARALAYEPKVLLLDEPFGALDVKIRSQLRRSLKEIQQTLHVTAVLVTHDQEEAFELADRIGVLEGGRLLEVGTGQSLYQSPRTLFVSTFLGAGMVLVGRVSGQRGRFGSFSVPIPADVPHEEGSRIQLLFRPEQVQLTEQSPELDLPVIGQGEIIEENFVGASRKVRLRLPHMANTRQITPAPPFGEEGLLVDAILPGNSCGKAKKLWVSLKGHHVLSRPDFRFLVLDRGRGSLAAMQTASSILERTQAVAHLVGTTEQGKKAEPLKQLLIERQRAAGLVTAETRVRVGNAVDQIVNEQVETVYELIVIPVEARRRTAGGRLLELSATSLPHWLDRIPLPLLAVKGEPRRLNKMLICTAGGEPSKSVVKEGGRLARHFGASVSLLHIMKQAEPDALSRHHLNHAAATLRAIDVESCLRFRRAEAPLQGILDEAREGDYDIIVVGHQKLPGRSVFRMSNVALQVVAAADRSVLIIPDEVF